MQRFKEQGDRSARHEVDCEPALHVGKGNLLPVGDELAWLSLKRREEVDDDVDHKEAIHDVVCNHPAGRRDVFKGDPDGHDHRLNDDQDQHQDVPDGLRPRVRVDHQSRHQVFLLQTLQFEVRK